MDNFSIAFWGTLTVFFLWALEAPIRRGIQATVLAANRAREKSGIRFIPFIIAGCMVSGFLKFYTPNPTVSTTTPYPFFSDARFRFEIKSDVSGNAFFRMDTVSGEIDIILVLSDGSITWRRIMQPEDKTGKWADALAWPKTQ